MTLQTLTHSQIQPSVINPRKTFNDGTIEELARSIKTDGLLQNLVVLKPKGKATKHSILAGERRFRAISYLIEQGELDKDFPIAVEIKKDLSEEEALRIATVENVQRENLAPLEEADALASLVGNGEKLDDIVAQTGLSVATIRRRLTLLNLVQAAKDALAEGKITLSQAEALTIGKPEDQEDALEDVTSGYYTSPDEIKDRLVGDLPTLSQAVFPKELYSGTFTRDLLAEEDATYFDDVEQFETLQRQAADALVAEYAKTHDWAELQEGYSFSRWGYTEAGDGEKGGVVVFLSNSGDVSIYEGLAKTRAIAATSAALKDGKEKAFYPTPLRRHIGMHKSLAVQAAILGNPRKAKEVAVCKKLSCVDVHGCLRYFENETHLPPALLTLNEEAGILLSDLKIEDKEGESSWKTLVYKFSHDAEGAYDAIQMLTDEELEAILLFLEVCEFGQWHQDRLDTAENSLFNKIARDLDVDMRDYWRPDEGFLKRRNKIQLQKIMNESGAASKMASAAEYKKGELVTKLVQYFAGAKSAETPTESDIQANDWLPEAMNFPAIDPDCKVQQFADEFQDEEEEDKDYAEVA